jgi:hypothetical protein
MTHSTVGRAMAMTRAMTGPPRDGHDGSRAFATRTAVAGVVALFLAHRLAVFRRPCGPDRADACRIGRTPALADRAPVSCAPCHCACCCPDPRRCSLATYAGWRLRGIPGGLISGRVCSSCRARCVIAAAGGGLYRLGRSAAGAGGVFRHQGLRAGHRDRGAAARVETRVERARQCTG